jgi:hypothetical protein
MRHLKFYSYISNISKSLILLCSLFFLNTSFVRANNKQKDSLSGSPTSTQQQAIAYLQTVQVLQPSIHWPNIKPEHFLKNLKNNIADRLSPYPGKGTNFCGYGALTYLFLQDDPLGYARLLIQLYQDGKAGFGASFFNPSEAVKQEAGQLKYKGLLDINPAEQMWYLTLADHYKGYLNIFNRNYDAGDENLFWASVNYAKFNRMARMLLHYKSVAKGADLMRPKVGDLYNYISNQLSKSTVVLFINNRIVHKKDHITIKLGVPTHFIVLEKISRQNGVVTLVYWDYGHRTLMQLSEAFLKRIVFGITSFTKLESDAK